MSYQPPSPAYPPAAGFPPVPPRERPMPVTLAAILMFIGAGFGIIVGLAEIATANHIATEFRNRAALTDAAPADIDSVGNTLQFGFVLSGIIVIVIALAVIALGFGVMRGSRPARIATWVLVGISLCCGVVSAAYSSIGGRTATLGAGNGSDETSRALADALSRAIPGWFAALAGVSCLQVLGYIAVIVLLAVPVSNAFFRREPVATWQPPYPAQAYPQAYPPPVYPPQYPPQGPFPSETGPPGSVPPGYPTEQPPPVPPPPVPPAAPPPPDRPAPPPEGPPPTP